MNIYEVAKRAGVSTATISRVLNNAPGVSPDTRAKVRAVMEECDYQPNAFARGLGLNTMSTIGLMCADVADPYLARAVSYLEKAFREKGYDSFLCCSGRAWNTRKSYMEMVLNRRVDGVVLIGSHFVENDKKKNAYILDAAQHVPVLMIGGALDAPGVYSVLCDDTAGMESMTGLVLENGAKHPVFLYSHASYSGLRKLKGFEQACRRAGIDIPEEAKAHLCSGNDTLDQVSRTLDEVRARYAFDAIIASEDLIAVGAVKYCKKHGLRVPEDVQVTGYNDSDIARACEPEITSLDNKLPSLCQRCVDTMMSALKKEEVPKQTVFSGEIQKRRSTK